MKGPRPHSGELMLGRKERSSDASISMAKIGGFYVTEPASRPAIS